MADRSDLVIERTLLLLRHAKAVPPETFDGADSDRPLADRGRADAAAVGRWLAQRDHAVDLVLCSTAARTRETWRHAAGGGVDAGDVWYDRRIYDADPDDLLEVVRDVPADAATVLVVGHAPAVPVLAEELARPDRSSARRRMREKFPTSGLAVLRSTAGWYRLAPGAAELADFVVPRG